MRGLALVVSDAFFAFAVRGNPEVDASTYLAADLGDGLTGWVPGATRHRRAFRPGGPPMVAMDTSHRRTDMCIR